VKGYHVRAAIRSAAKAAGLPKSPHLETISVPDIVAPGAYTEAVRNVSAVIHIASPYTFGVNSNEELLIPARDGTLNILRAAAKEKSVKRMIITSSLAAVMTMGIAYDEPPKVLDENDWNPATWEQALVGPSRLAYMASKKYAERAAWGNSRHGKFNVRFREG
jgi:NADPH-dependent methylglyoxal reductase